MPGRLRPRRGVVVGAVSLLALALGLALFGRPGRRLLLLPLASVAAPYLYLPWRHLLYPVAVAVAVGLPAALASLFDLAVRITGRPGLTAAADRRAVAGLCGLVAWALFGGAGSPRAGWTVRAAPLTDLARCVDELPDDALLAGWPGRPIDSLPYLTGRDVYLSFEMHQVFHAGYAKEMRRRWSATIDGVFAADLTGLAELRRDRVTHLLASVRHYGRRVPWTFAPFAEPTAVAARRISHPEALALWQQDVTIRVCESPPWVVFDLRALPTPVP